MEIYLPYLYQNVLILLHSKPEYSVYSVWWNLEHGLHRLKQVGGRSWIYVQHVNLRTARRFTCCPQIYGHLVPIHAPRCSFITQVSRHQSKGKITPHDPKNSSTLFFSILHHNIYLFQGVIIPDALNIKRGDFYCHSHLKLLLFSSEFNSAMHLWNFVVTPITLRYRFLSF